MNPERELEILHSELAELYRGGSVAYVRIKRLWDRIEFLEARSDG